MRAFNVADAVFILFLGLRLSGVRPEISAFVIFSPYLVEFVLVIISKFWDARGYSQKLAWWILKRKIESDVKKAAGKAWEAGRKAGSSNPGKSYDPELNAKKPI